MEKTPTEKRPRGRPRIHTDRASEGRAFRQRRAGELESLRAEVEWRRAYQRAEDEARERERQRAAEEQENWAKEQEKRAKEERRQTKREARERQTLEAEQSQRRESEGDGPGSTVWEEYEKVRHHVGPPPEGWDGELASLEAENRALTARFKALLTRMRVVFHYNCAWKEVGRPPASGWPPKNPEDAAALLGGYHPTKKALAAAWHELMKEHHPDVGGDHERAVEINREYERICKARDWE